MNIQNLSQEEIKNLHTLLGKMLEEPKEEDTNPVDKMVGDILEYFNFNKVRKAMWHLDWKWAPADSEVPSIEQLKETAERLLRGAAESRLVDCFDSHWELGVINGTGGFQATAYCDRMKTRITGLDLKFVVAEWDERGNEE